MRSAVHRVWDKIAPSLQGPSRRSGVKGFLGAVVASLVDIEWKPLGALKWQDTGGRVWELDPDRPGVFFELEFRLLSEVQGHIWSKAAKHHLGKGLEAGVDWTVARKHLRVWRQRGLLQHEGCFKVLAQAAIWPRARKFSCSLVDDDVCPRCGQCADTPLHQF